MSAVLGYRVKGRENRSGAQLSPPGHSRESQPRQPSASPGFCSSRRWRSWGAWLRTASTTAAFSPALDGRSLSFEPADDGFTDAETGSTWNIQGVAVGGELEGERLDPVEHLSTFWFAWVAFTPETEIAD